MFKKLFFVFSIIFISFFSINVNAADTYPNDPYLYDKNGITTISTSFDKFTVIGNIYDKRPADFKAAKAYVAVYNSDKSLASVYDFSDLNGKSINQALPEFEKGKNMRVRLFVWNSTKPLYSSYEVTYKNTFMNSLVLEAEDIICSEVYLTNDTNASGGKAAVFSGHIWDHTQLATNSMYTNIYVNNSTSRIMCNLWMRCYTTSTQTASIYQDLNVGEFSAKFFNEKTDDTYRWISTKMYLNPGMNYIAFKHRCPSRIDKFIITTNLNYVPDGLGDVPPDASIEDLENQWASYWNEPTIKPISSHPRLYVTQNTKDEFIKRISTGDYAWIYNKFKGYANETLNCTLDTTKANNHDSYLLTKILSRALCYMTGEETEKSHAQQTIEYMKEYLTTVRTPDDQGDITRTRGDIMVAAAIVYDWCYDALTNSDKEFFISQFKEIAASKEIGWPPVNMSSVASHAGEQEIFRDLLSAGVAIYNEYPLMYNISAGRLFDEMLPARNWLRKAGRFEMGNDYGEARAYSEVWADAIFKAMGYDSIYGDIGSQNLRWLIYSRLPYGSMMPSGDMYTLDRTNPDYYNPNYVLTMAIASNIYNDSILKQEFNRRFNMGYYSEENQFYFMLFNNPSISGEIWDNLPLSSVSKYPFTAAIARTSWQEGYRANTAIGFMNMHEVFVGDHQNIFTGDFQIYYKGLLAMNTGVYNESTQHNEGYKRRSIAGNVMLCYDPDETFTPSWSNVTVPNDGGQRNPYVNENGESKGSSVNLFTEFNVGSNGISQNEELTVAKNVKTYTGPNESTPAFTYVGGDLTNAYSDKVENYERHMVFADMFDDETPAAFIVYDKMTAKDASFKKTWLLHSQEEPTLNNNIITIKRTEGEFNGKLTNKVLLPENPYVNIVGGNDMFTVGGIDMTPVNKPNTVEQGNYRIEVSSSSQNKEDTFLNAMYVSNADSDAALEMTKYEDESFIGVMFKDRLVLFNKTMLDISGFSIEVSQNTLVFVSGLEDGNYMVGNTVASTHNGCITLELSKGTHKVIKTTVTSSNFVLDENTKNKIGDFFVWHTASDNGMGYGNYLYLPSPTIYENQICYIPYKVLEEFGATVNVNGSVVEVAANGKTKSVNTITKNNTVYVNPSDVASVINYTFSYNANAKVLTATKK